MTGLFKGLATALHLTAAKPLELPAQPCLIPIGAARSDQGQCREHNEDSLLWIHAGDNEADRGSLAVVADGMGGAQGGAVASDLAVQVIRDFYYTSRTEPGQALREAFVAANREIFRIAEKHPDLNGMGTTCVAAVFRGTSLWAAWTGDARLYLSRHGAVYQLSQDDTVVAELVRHGKLTEAEARAHEGRHVVTRSLGTRPSLEVGGSAVPVPVMAGDRLLLCSDGVHDLLDDSEIGTMLKLRSPHEAVEALLQECNSRGGYDNASAVVVELAAPETSAGATEPVPAAASFTEASLRGPVLR